MVTQQKMFMHNDFPAHFEKCAFEKELKVQKKKENTKKKRKQGVKSLLDTCLPGNSAILQHSNSIEITQKAPYVFGHNFFLDFVNVIFGKPSTGAVRQAGNPPIFSIITQH